MWTIDRLDRLSDALRHAICTIKLPVVVTIDGERLPVSGMTSDHAVGHNGVAKIQVRQNGQRFQIEATDRLLDEIADQVTVR